MNAHASPRSSHMLASAVTAILLASAASGGTSSGQCGSDLDGDGVVDGADLTVLLQQWGACAGCTADTNGDGVVSGADLTALLVSWGTVCTPWYEVLEQAPDPMVVTNPALRKAIAASGHPWRVRDTATQIEMLLVPAGSFSMGCSQGDEGQCSSNEYPRHQVALTSAYYIGRYEVKQGEWEAVTGTNPSNFQGQMGEANYPVEMVSWLMIEGFLANTGLRLPTEAEWEYAYRAGTSTGYHSAPTFPDGTNSVAVLDEIAWHVGNNGSSGTPSYGTKPVGLKAANALGLHDMSGNVWEWIADWYGDSYYASSPAANPQGPSTGDRRCVRGGSWVTPGSLLRGTTRDRAYPDLQNVNLGFRVVRNP